MINDYYEYKYALSSIIENTKIEDKYLSRFINLLARRFTYIFLDKNGNFVNDYYKLVDKKNNDKYRYSKKRLRLSKNFINYLINGEYEVKENPEQTRNPHEKFFEYLKENLRKDNVDEETIDAIIKYREDNNKINLTKEKVSIERIEFANLDAVIEGPLRKNIGVVYTKEQLVEIINLFDERSGKGKLQFNCCALAIMIVSYYFYYYNKTHKLVIPFIKEHHKLLHMEITNYWSKSKGKIGFEDSGLLGVDNIIEGSINGVHLSNTTMLDKIFKDGYPKIVIAESDSKVMNINDNNKIVYVDKGTATFKELKKFLADFCKTNNIK